jgi:hypothetical protein
LQLAGKTLGPRAIQDHRVLQGLRARKVFRELRECRGRLAPRVHKGRKVLPEIREKKERRETRATEARRVTLVPRFVLSRPTGK